MVLQQDQIIDQKVIPTLVIPSDYITVRYDVASIMLCSLLHLITQATPTDPTFSQTLVSVLSGGNFHTGVATVCVPAFAEVGQLKSPGYGYRQLGNISRLIPFQLQLVPQSLDQQNEVFAVDPDHIKSQEYSRIWRMFGLKMDRHFILLLNIPQNHSSTSSPSSRSSLFGGLSPHLEPPTPLVSFLHQTEIGNAALIGSSGPGTPTGDMSFDVPPLFQHASPIESYLSSAGGML